MTTQFKADRESCWNARDKYWSCLDANNEIVEKCVKFRKEFEKCCSKQWVKHFDRKRKYEDFKSKIDEIGWELPPKDERK